MLNYYSIGVDIGGTFTDLVVADETGQVFSAKAFTTPHDYSEGITNALDTVVEQLGLSVRDLLSRTRVFVNGTTIVTNALAELKGVKVGLLTTLGFKDTLRIARSARTNDFNLQSQVPPPELVSRDHVVEIHERINYAGEVVVPLDVEHATRQIRNLVEVQNVEALAVCLLWSFRNSNHERIIKNIIHELYPTMFVTISSDIYPVSREYERMVTTVLNSYSSRGAESYLVNLEQRLRDRGLTVPVGIMQSTGGITSTDDARQKPIHLLNSGPVGGVVAANRLGELLGLKNIITADMGGTSFDTAVIVENQIGHIHRARVNRLDTGLSLVDIHAIGAGGGSICHVTDQGLPEVGPESAGAEPGPACYGRGGQEPCVTDVAEAINLIDPHYFLGGALTLDQERALEVIEEKIAKPLGLDTAHAAAGLYDLVVSNMSNAVRAVTIERGHDPRDFALLAYGGASALYIAAIAQDMGIRRVVIPHHASVFSAEGLLLSDYSRSSVQTVNWNLAKGNISELNTVFDTLSQQVTASLQDNGFSAGDIDLTWEGDFKFGTQVYELTILIPHKELTEEDKALLAQRFIAEYERLYGQGASWENAENLIVILNLRVTGVGRTAKPGFVAGTLGGSDASDASIGNRQIFLPDRETEESVSIFRDERFLPGMRISGPAVIEARDTTIYVPYGVEAEMDVYRNYSLTLA